MSSKAVRKLITIGLVVALALIFSFTAKSFFTTRNITLMLKDGAFLGLIALGASVVMVGGGVDLSAGGIACITGILCSRLSFTGLPGVFIIIAGILIGSICGLINAMLVTRIRLTEFVATLASGFVFSGAGLILAFRDNGKVSGTLISKSISNKSFLAFGKDINGIFYLTIVWIILSVIMYLVFTKTNFGLHTYSIGSNAKSARMSGVNVDRVKALGYIISGCFAGFASVMWVALLGTATSSLGSGYEFQAIAACVVGGIVLGGGKGDAASAFIGSLFMILISNGVIKYNLPTAWQQYIIQGIIILAFTAFDTQFNKFTAKRLMTRQH